jgi:hypothetical protein
MRDPQIDVDAMRARIVRACDEVGFPKPTPDDTLPEWADDSLDNVLQRGAKRWQSAHAHVIDAYEAAMVGNEDVLRRCLVLARDLAKSAPKCECDPKKLPHRVEGGINRWCVVCGGRAS